MPALRPGAHRLLCIALALWAALAQRGAHWPAQPLPRGLGMAAAAWPSAGELQTLGASWYYVYGLAGDLPRSSQRVLMIPLAYDETALESALRAHPGAWWMVGNEPNDPAQDNLSPGAYAALYQRVSALARRVDASAQLIPAGIANADWGWAHDWRASYRAQYGRYPHVDAWNIHDYILDPERSPYDLPEFQRRVLEFRSWMARVGEGDKPLILSEFGLLQGDVRADQAAAYLQAASQWLAQSGQVQAWAWFSNYTSGQFGGDLLDAQGALTPLGEAFQREAFWLTGSAAPAATPSATPTVIVTRLPLAAAATVRPSASATLRPSRTPTATDTATPTATSSPTPLPATATPRPTLAAAPTDMAAALAAVTPAPPGPALYATRQRLGVAFSSGYGAIESYPIDQLPFGWYLDWQFRERPAAPAGIEFVQTVRTGPGNYPPDWAALRRAAAANPGALWLVGNEPECIHQDGRAPDEYAAIYHEVYVALKAADPTARVAIGGVVEPTPLRLAWLDRVLAAYAASYGAPLPADAWNTHNQLLQERRGEYGCDIPVGLAADAGVGYAFDENDSLEHFRAHIWALRRWMAERGYRDKPLIVSEFGVLMPRSLLEREGQPGSGEARVIAFMQGSIGWMLTASDAAIGCPTDGNRLVQRWAWFSLNGPNWEEEQAANQGFNGGLCHPTTRALTVYGEAYRRLAAGWLAGQP